MNEVLKHTWTKIWTTKYSMLSLALFGDEYIVEMKKDVGAGFDHILFRFERGLATLFRIESETNTTARKLAEQSLSMEYVERCTNELLRLRDEMLAIVETDSSFTLESFEKFKEIHLHLISYFLVPMWASNELKNVPGNDHIKEKALSLYAHVRKETETLYPKIELFIEKVYSEIGVKHAIDPKYLQALLPNELEEYLRNSKLPEEAVLKERFAYSLFYRDLSSTYIAVGNEAMAIVDEITKIKEKVTEIKGTKAYAGNVRGSVRIIFRDEDCDSFKDGEILVTTMTRPEWLPIMKKAGAYVTDAGGILCHAAIVAREMKVPCVTNTKIATQVLKTGDMVEVDAEKGTVKIIK